MKDDNPPEVPQFNLLIYDGYLLKADDVNLQNKKIAHIRNCNTNFKPLVNISLNKLKSLFSSVFVLQG